MDPDTCDPTWTVITELMVPVASTTSWISPRSTFAVKCCTCVSRCSPNATNNPATATTAAKMSHLRFVIYVWSRKSQTLHSYRSASIGSSRDALRAGEYPKSTPTATENIAATTTASTDISMGQPRVCPTK